MDDYNVQNALSFEVVSYLLLEKLIVHPQSIHSIEFLLQPCIALTQLLDIVTCLGQDPTFTLHRRAEGNLRQHFHLV